MFYGESSGSMASRVPLSKATLNLSLYYYYNGFSKSITLYYMFIFICFVL